MRHHEISRPEGTGLHPHVATILLEPTAFARLKQLTEDRADIKILCVDRSNSDRWTVFAGCVSKKGKDLLEGNWQNSTHGSIGDGRSSRSRRDA